MKSPLRLAGFSSLDQPDSLLNRIAAATPQADPFCCRSEWQFSFHEAFSPERALHFRECAGSLLAVAERQHPRVGTVIEPIESSWLFGCPLLGPDSVALLASFLREAEHQLAPPFVLLSGLLPGSKQLRSVAGTFSRRFEVVKLAPAILRSASLAGGVDGFLSRRSPRFRHNLRRAARRSGERGVYFERARPCSVAEAETVYARMLSVEEASWKGIGRCGMAEPPSRDFYRLMLRRLSASGSGRVIFARQAERDIGFVFGGLAGPHYRGQQFSYREEWHAFSIGNLLQQEQIQWLCEDGVERYDMGPRMEYKLHWAELELRSEARLLRPRV